MRLARSPSPDVLVLREGGLFPAGMAVFLVAMAIGFLSMATDPDMRAKTRSGTGPAGSGSRIAWVAFAIGSLVGAGFIATQQRHGITIDRKAGIVRESFGVIIAVRSTARKLGGFDRLTLKSLVANAPADADWVQFQLSLEGPTAILAIDVGKLKSLAPLAQSIAEHTGLPLSKS